MNIGFIGLGKLGLPSAEVMAKNGNCVSGYDIIPVESEHVNIVNSVKDVVFQKDIVFVAVPTPHDKDYGGVVPAHDLTPRDFDYSDVIDVLKEANKHMNDGQLLVLISTVLPSVTREKLQPLTYNTKFLYNPYLIAMGTVEYDMVHPEMIMIGTEDGDKNGEALILEEFYKGFVEEGTRYIIGTWDECECIKIFYNTFISFKISFVNMIQDVAVRQGNIDVDVVTDALIGSTMRITSGSYMKSGMGDGGPCHPRDNIALRYLAEKLDLGYDIFSAIVESREKQAENLAKFILEYGKIIKFTSDSYKPGVDVLSGSYSLLTQYYINILGGVITQDYYDADVIVKVHESDVIPDDIHSIIIDPWRTHPNSIYYGKPNNERNRKYENN